MQEIGMDLNATGSVLSRGELAEHRKKRGECIKCGRKCFKKKLLKMIPITDHGRVLNGRCLNCNPLEVTESDGGVLPATTRPATQADLERFSRSQLQLGTSSRNLSSSTSSSVTMSTRNISTTSTSSMRGSTGTSTRSFSRRPPPRLPSRGSGSSERTAPPRMPSRTASVPVISNQSVPDSNGYGGSLSDNISVNSRNTPGAPEHRHLNPTNSARTLQSAPSTLNSRVMENTPMEGSSAVSLSGMEVTACMQDPALISPQSAATSGMQQGQPQMGQGQDNYGAVPGQINSLDRGSAHSSLMERNDLGDGDFSNHGVEDPNSVNEALDRIHGLYQQQPNGPEGAPGPGGDQYYQTQMRYAPPRSYSGSRSEPGVAMRRGQLDRGGQTQQSYFPSHAASSRTLNSMSSIEEDCAADLVGFDLPPGLYEDDKAINQSDRCLDNSGRGEMRSMNSSGHSQMRARQPNHEQIAIDRFESVRGDFVQILGIMRESGDQPYMQLEGLKELSILHLSEEDLHILSQQGAMDVVANAMRSFPSDLEIQVYGTRAIWNTSGTENNQLRYADAGAVDVLLANMDQYLDNDEIQECSMATLSNLAAAELNLQILIERGTVGRVVEAMNSHSDNRIVCIKGCSVITNMASHISHLKKDIMDLGGGGAVVIAMVMHPNDDELQEKALRAIRNLSSKNDDNKIELANIGGIEAVISAMQIHRDQAGVQEAGAWALSNLGGNDDNKAVIGDGGGLDVVVRAMWVHNENVSVLEWCCRALYTLTLDRHNSNMVLEVGGISAVINSMQAHVDSGPVQEMGCAILANLAHDEISKRRIVDEEALDAIVLAMVLFGDDARVQERACQVLSNLAIVDNFRHMRASNVGELVRTAAEKFPGNCQDSASVVLHVFETCAAQI